MKFSFEKQATYLDVTVTGAFELDEAIEGFQQILDGCRATGLTAALVDFSGIVWKQSATFRVMFAMSARERYDRYLADGGKRMRMAFLGGERSFLSWQPGVEIAAAPGLGTFTDRDAALAWLEQG